jgi:hypothetical protein
MKNYQVIFTFTVAVFLQVSCQKNVADSQDLFVKPYALEEQTSEIISEEEAVVCGQLRTQSPGGWGTSPAGFNPAVYLAENFTNAFPWGIMIGCRDGRTLTLTSADAVQNFLPAGGKPAVLNDFYTDPVGMKNSLASHLVALSLSVGLDYYDPNFGAAQVNLGDMMISSGAFEGMTVSQFLMAANDIVGGCGDTYTIGNVISTASNINNNYLDGMVDMGFLKCPDTGPRRIGEVVPR